MNILSPPKRACCLLAAALLLAGCSHVADRVAAFRPPEPGPRVQFETARQHERDGKLGPAREMYEELHQADPQDAAVCHRLAVVCLRAGDRESAMRHFAEARRLDPRNADLLNDLGYAHYVNEDLAAAEATLRAALQEAPSHRRATINLALVVGVQGRMEESFSLFRQVVDEAEANANVAYIHAQRGEGREAIEHYRRALSLNGNLKSAAQALVQLAETERRLEQERRLHGVPARQQLVQETPPPPQNPIQTVAATQPDETTSGAVRVAGFSEQRDGGAGIVFADFMPPADDAEPHFDMVAAEETTEPATEFVDEPEDNAEPRFGTVAAEETTEPAAELVDEPEIVPSLDEEPSEPMAEFADEPETVPVDEEPTVSVTPDAPPPHPPAETDAGDMPPAEPPRLWSDEQGQFQWQTPR